MTVVIVLIHLYSTLVRMTVVYVTVIMPIKIVTVTVLEKPGKIVVVYVLVVTQAMMLTVIKTVLENVLVMIL